MSIDTREKILKIATNLFAQKGFAGVSIRELTIAADVNISAISYHFHGKEELYKEVLKEQLYPIIEAVDIAEEKKDVTPVEKLKLWSELVVKIHMENPLLIKFMSSELNNPTKNGGSIVQNHLSRVYNFLRQAIQEGVNEGIFRKNLNINYSAVSLVSILNFYFFARPMIGKVSSVTDADLTTYPKEALDIYLKGIIIDNNEI
ncbi:TetR family transcriptional regulator [Selenomonadales bacterium OttesenSCG-928-I06]|nr:TetR family transcriptional regulator [Selenomonadales bacterium OttesenSCG-928-I06]